MASLNIDINLTASTRSRDSQYTEDDKNNSTIDRSIKDYVDAVYSQYIMKLLEFQPVANNKSFTDEMKLGQLSLFIADIASTMANKYPEKVDDHNKLIYDIALALACDSRICSIVGVARAIWDRLPDVPDYLELAAFNTMLAIRKMSKLLDNARKTGCFCFTSNAIEVVEAMEAQ